MALEAGMVTEQQEMFKAALVHPLQWGRLLLKCATASGHHGLIDRFLPLV